MDLKEKALAVVKESIDLKKMSHAVIDEILEPALKKVVEDSSNKLDDVLMAAIYPVLEKEVKAKLDGLVDALYE